MSIVGRALDLGERLPLPDTISRAAIKWIIGRTQQRLASAVDVTPGFSLGMRGLPIAAATAQANEQHYELPTEFFELALGPQLKYSCCLFSDDQSDLAVAEECALAETAANAALADGQQILELGCGWGSLSLWMAGRFPNARILSVSNSYTQRDYIECQAAAWELSNLKVVTADMNDFTTNGPFDRVISVEMFEHMSNWPELLSRIHDWLDPDGRLFIHVFSHTTSPYRFDASDDRDWIARHFFTGGIMPSHGLLRACADLFEVEAEWRWNGENYARTARAWLANLDANSESVTAILEKTYGPRARLWLRRWRLFFLATEGLFGFNHGNDWGVSQYRLKSR